VPRIVAECEKRTVNFWVERFNAAVHHFREASYVGNFGNINVVFTERFSCSAGLNYLNAKPGMGFGKFYSSGFVGKADKGTADLTQFGNNNGSYKNKKRPKTTAGKD
jgi:hypothetical protein